MSGWFGEIIGPLFAYAERKRLTQRPFREYHDRAETWEDFPEGWEEMVLGMLAGYAAAGSRKHAAAFCRSQAEQLSHGAAAIAREWRSVPWTHVFLSGMESIGGDLVRAVPLGTRPASWAADAPAWDELLIYSPSLARGAESGASHAFALLWWSGKFFGTYGVVIPFASFDTDDLLFFAAALLARGSIPAINDEAAPVSDHLARHALDALTLFRWQNVPHARGREGDWTRLASVIEMPADDPEISQHAVEEAFWHGVVERAGGTIPSIATIDGALVVQFGADRPMYEPTLYVVPSQRVAYLSAMNRTAWDRGRAILADVLPFPEQPQSRVSMSMYAISREILDYRDEPSRLQSILDERAPDNEDESPFTDTLNAVFGRLSTNYNEGRVESDEQIAEALGVPSETVAQLRAELERILGSSEPNEGGGQSSYGAPAERLGLAPAVFSRLTSQELPTEPTALAIRDTGLRPYSESETRTLRHTPILRFAEWLVDVSSTSRGRRVVPATTAGNVAVKVVARAIEDEIITPLFSDGTQPREHNVPEFHRYRRILESAGLLTLHGSHFVLDDDLLALGSTDAPGAVSRVMPALITNMFVRYPWDEGRYDRPLPYLRRMAAFLFYAVRTLSTAHGNQDRWVPLEELVDTFIDATPPIRDAVEKDAAAARDAEARGILYPGVRWAVEAGVRFNLVSNFGEPLGLLDAQAAEQTDGINYGKSVAVRPGPAMAICFVP